MNAETIVHAVPFKKDQHLNPQGHYDLLVCSVEKPIIIVPGVVAKTTWKLVSSTNRIPERILDQKEAGYALPTYFFQTCVVNRIVNGAPAPMENKANAGPS